MVVYFFSTARSCRRRQRADSQQWTDSCITTRRELLLCGPAVVIRCKHSSESRLPGDYIVVLPACDASVSIRRLIIMMSPHLTNSFFSREAGALAR
jgi:hypothetical protein